MSKIIVDKNNLNPGNLEDIEEVLKKGKNEWLWFMLDDSIPSEGKDVEIVNLDLSFDGFDNLDEEKVIDVQPYCCLVTDKLFYAETEEELEDADLSYLIPYVPMVKESYVPFFCTYGFTPNATRSDVEKLKNIIINNGGYFNASLEKKPDSIEMYATFIGCDKNINTIVYAY